MKRLEGLLAAVVLVSGAAAVLGAPGRTFVESPVPGDTRDRRPVFRWSVSDDATQYLLRITRNGSPYLDKWSRKTQWEPKFDLPEGVFEARVIGYDGAEYGQWSPRVKFRRVFTPAISVLNGLTGDGAEITLEAGSGIFIDKVESNRTIVISSGGVTATQIVALSVTTEKIDTHAVTYDKLADDAVYGGRIADDGIASNKLADGVVETRHLAGGAVTSAKLADDAVTAAKLADDAVYGGRIADDGIASNKLADGVVETRHLAGGAVTSAKLADDAVTAAKLADDAVYGGRIADDGIASNKLADGVVESRHLAGESVGSAKLAGYAVTAAKLASEAVTSDKLATGAVTSNKIAAGQVLLSHLDAASALIGQAIVFNGSVWMPASIVAGYADGGIAIKPVASEEGAIALGDNAVASAGKSAVLGGWINTIYGDSDFSVVAGGENNTITSGAKYSAIIGGKLNLLTKSYSFASGLQARATNEGSFVWADSSGGGTGSWGTNTVTFMASGGVRFQSATAGLSNHRVQWKPGDATWTFSSDRNLKEGIEPVDKQEVLSRLSEIPVARWRFKGSERVHIGVMAQDFHGQFPLPGSEATMIDSADLHGVSMAALQALHEQLKAEQQKNAALEARLEALEKRLAP